MNHFSNLIISVKVRQNKISHVIVSRAGRSCCSVTTFLLGCLRTCACVCVRVCVFELHVTVLLGCIYVSMHNFYLPKSKWRFKWRGVSLKSVKFASKSRNATPYTFSPLGTHLSHTCAPTTHLCPHQRVKTASSICNPSQPRWLLSSRLIYARMVAWISSWSPQHYASGTK